MRHAFLAGDIGSPMFGFTAERVVGLLEGAERDGESITFHVNSPGGDIGEAVMIDAMIRAFAQENPELEVITEVDGYAASAASFAFLSSSRIVAHPSSLFMIHDPSSWAWGQADDLRREAGVLDKCKSAIVASYVRRTGRYADEIARLMAEETWFTAEEAVDFGLADALLDGSANPTVVTLTYEPDHSVLSGEELPVIDDETIGKKLLFIPPVENAADDAGNRRDSERVIEENEQGEAGKPEVEATDGCAGEAPAYGVIAGHVYQIVNKESEGNA